MDATVNVSRTTSIRRVIATTTKRATMFASATVAITR